jgi:hypothetical protein
MPFDSRTPLKEAPELNTEEFLSSYGDLPFVAILTQIQYAGGDLKAAKESPSMFAEILKQSLIYGPHLKRALSAWAQDNEVMAGVNCLGYVSKQTCIENEWEFLIGRDDGVRKDPAFDSTLPLESWISLMSSASILKPGQSPVSHEELWQMVEQEFKSSRSWEVALGVLSFLVRYAEVTKGSSLQDWKEKSTQ